MNLIDAISNPHFPKKLFPNGITNIFLADMHLSGGTFYFSIATSDKPAITVKKYGEWGKDYNILKFEFDTLVKKYIKVNIRGNYIYNKYGYKCDYFIKKEAEYELYVKFMKDNLWSFEFKTGSRFAFQRCTVYKK